MTVITRQLLRHIMNFLKIYGVLAIISMCSMWSNEKPIEYNNILTLFSVAIIVWLIHSIWMSTNLLLTILFKQIHSAVGLFAHLLYLLLVFTIKITAIAIGMAVCAENVQGFSINNTYAYVLTTALYMSIENYMTL